MFDSSEPVSTELSVTGTTLEQPESSDSVEQPVEQEQSEPVEQPVKQEQSEPVEQPIQ